MPWDANHTWWVGKHEALGLFAVHEKARDGDKVAAFIAVAHEYRLVDRAWLRNGVMQTGVLREEVASCVKGAALVDRLQGLENEIVEARRHLVDLALKNAGFEEAVNTAVAARVRAALDKNAAAVVEVARLKAFLARVSPGALEQYLDEYGLREESRSDSDLRWDDTYVDTT